MTESPQRKPASRPLPPGLELLWGRRERGKRGPRPGLSADAIVDAAIRVADAEGLEGVSMARVAGELGFTTMSLYRYVDSKEALLQLMWNGSARGAEYLVIEGDDWRARLRSWSVYQWEMLEQHPWVTQMPLAAPPMAPNSMHFIELALDALNGTGLTGQQQIRIIAVLTSYTLSEARMAEDARRAAKAARADARPADPAGGEAAGEAAQQPESFGSLLRELVDEQTFPHLYRLAWGAEQTTSTAREDFLQGLDIILDGVQARIDQVRRARP